MEKKQVYVLKFYDFDDDSGALVAYHVWNFTVSPLKVYDVVLSDVKKGTQTRMKVSKELHNNFLAGLKAWMFRREKSIGNPIGSRAQWSLEPEFNEEDMREIRKLWMLEEL